MRLCSGSSIYHIPFCPTESIYINAKKNIYIGEPYSLREISKVEEGQFKKRCKGAITQKG